MPFQSVFDEAWDVVIVGAGYAGFAAAWQCRRDGRRALLVDRDPALLRESSWAFSPHTEPLDAPAAGPLWREWRQRLAVRGALRAGQTDGALAELIATELCHHEALPVLFYAAPLRAELRGDLLTGIVTATKGGLRRLTAAQWIDATETGELLPLLHRGWRAPVPVAQEWYLHFRSAHWNSADEVSLEQGAPHGLHLRWQPTLWPNERALRVRLTGAADGNMAGWLPSLQLFHDSGMVDLQGAVLSHGSIIPWRSYAAPAALPQLPRNVVTACAALGGPAAETLRGRFEYGLAAVETLQARPRARLDESRTSAPLADAVDSSREITADVIVAGLGTGGALAAVAAARAGARVAAFDALPFAGGISSGGGIHYYWFGVRGGLQQELDDRVRAAMPLFGTAAQVRGFHPDAKKLVLHAMLQEAGVDSVHGALLCQVHRAGPRLESIATTAPAGPLRWRAAAWIDSTGDGDLCALAGMPYRWGREGDGRLAAYSQSSGRANVLDGKAYLEVINFDAGFVDPSSAEDLTRARQHGLRHYLQESYDEIERSTYIAPALGVRQSRHIETDYAVTLADLIEGRGFADAVSYAGGHFDNRTRDFEFESDEALFWVWVCHQHGGRLACEVPYRALLPQGLDNVWVACRALGMTTDAHYCVRMQRDMQRVGEVAGTAAALAAAAACGSRGIAFPALRAALERTGALAPVPSEGDPLFGDPFGPRSELETAPASGDPAPDELKGWLQELAEAPSGRFLWQLFKNREAAAAPLHAMLDSPDDLVSWRAAAVMAMWGEGAAEARLLRAVHSREAGDEARELTTAGQENLFVPRWLVAISLLRRCGSPACLGSLETLAHDAGLVFNARTAIALTAAAVLGRHPVSVEHQDRWAQMLDLLLASPAPGAVRQVQSRLVTEGAGHPAPDGGLAARENAVENFEWQLHLTVGRARALLGLPLHPASEIFRQDARGLVRRSFQNLIESQT